MTGFDQKLLRLSHDRPFPLRVRIEVDITGSALWAPYATFEVPAGGTFEHRFPAGYNAYWLRTAALADGRITAQLQYR